MTIHLGDLKVSFVPDGAVQGRPREWLPDTDDEVWAAHPEYLDDAGYLVASIGGLLVERGDRALLIDAGFGPQSLPPDPATPNGAIYGGALLDNLAALGRRPDQIEAVAFTHLHVDHIGWREAFPRREYRFFPGVRAEPTGGHTAGHTQYVLTGGGKRLIAFGDAMHTPLQVEHPEWSCVYDEDPAGAAEHRRRLLAELDDPDTIGFGNHFAGAVFGQVRRRGAGLTWCPVD